MVAEVNNERIFQNAFASQAFDNFAYLYIKSSVVLMIGINGFAEYRGVGEIWRQGDGFIIFAISAGFLEAAFMGDRELVLMKEWLVGFVSGPVFSGIPDVLAIIEVEVGFVFVGSMIAGTFEMCRENFEIRRERGLFEFAVVLGCDA